MGESARAAANFRQYPALKVWNLYNDFRSYPRYLGLLKRINLHVDHPD